MRHAKKRIQNLAAASTALGLLLFFNNCDGGFEARSDSALSSSSSCKLSTNTTLMVMNFNPNTDCNIASDISCEVRSFLPNVHNDQAQSEACLNTSEYGEVCLDLSTTTYDTSAADGTAEDFLPGGTYNYTEYNCYNKKFLHDNQPIFQSSESSLAEALTRLHIACKSGGDS
jgi:hypothetical protein